ncbi:MAG: carbohydrate ABC transporter permease [Anaerolineae bacterium]|nr:carbohydrate ABC transporter permease [Anaerolineae bacterium]
MMRGWGIRVVTYLGAVLLAMFILAPLAWVFLSSVLPEASILSFPPDWFQYGFMDANYKYIFTGEIPRGAIATATLRTMISQEVRLVPRTILNSFIVASVVMLINCLIGSLAAYAFARLRFAGKTPVFFFITLSRLIPTVALAIPYYLIVQRSGLIDTYWALIIIYSVLTLPFTLLILTLYFRGIPEEIEEAAQLDGCSPFQTLVRVTIPLALPSLIGTGLFAFMLSYSEFLFGLLITQSIKTRTLPVILAAVSWNPDVTWGLTSASITIGLIPTLLLVVPVWRYMVKGLVAGGVY